jgi:hypothetical protein
MFQCSLLTHSVSSQLDFHIVLTPPQYTAFLSLRNQCTACVPQKIEQRFYTTGLSTEERCLLSQPLPEAGSG